MKFIFYPSSCTFLSPFRIHLQRTILPGALYAYPAFSLRSDDPTPLFLHHRLRSSDEKGHLQRLRHRCFRRFENSGKNHAHVNRSDDRRGDPACLRLPGCPRIPPRKPPETHRLPLRPGSPLHRKNVLLRRRHQSPPRPLQTTRPRLYHRPDRLPHPQQHRNHLLYPKRLLHSRQSPKPPLHPPRRPPRHPVRNHRQHRHSKPYVNLYSFTFSPGLHKNNHMPIISYLYHQLSQKPLPIQRITHTFSPVLPL